MHNSLEEDIWGYNGVGCFRGVFLGVRCCAAWGDVGFVMVNHVHPRLLFVYQSLITSESSAIPALQCPHIPAAAFSPPRQEFVHGDARTKSFSHILLVVCAWSTSLLRYCTWSWHSDSSLGVKFRPAPGCVRSGHWLSKRTPPVCALPILEQRRVMISIGFRSGGWCVPRIQ